jgi:hypothetical protein
MHVFKSHRSQVITSRFFSRCSSISVICLRLNPMTQSEAVYHAYVVKYRRDLCLSIPLPLSLPPAPSHTPDKELVSQPAGPKLLL